MHCFMVQFLMIHYLVLYEVKSVVVASGILIQSDVL